MGKQTAGNALLFRDPLNAEGIRSKAITVCSGAWGGETNTWTVDGESVKDTNKFIELMVQAPTKYRS